MKNLFKSKKFNSFLLTMIMCLSLFLFSACADIKGEDEGGGGGSSGTRAIYKLIYRPYSTSIPDGGAMSYGQMAALNILDLSEDVLSRLVGEYGIGEVSVKDGDSTKLVSPKVEVDYQNLLGLTSAPTEVQKMIYAQEFSGLSNVYYTSQNNKVLVLSNYSISLANLLEYDTANSKYIAKSSLISLKTNSTISIDGELSVQNVYKYSESGNIAYVFIGESIGSNSINGIDNVKNYVSKFFKSNFGSMQKSLMGNLSIIDGSDRDLPFSAWKWSLTDSEFASCLSAEDYQTKYITKFKLSMGVEIAKTILTRYEELTLPEELNNLYTQASVGGADESKKVEFISSCCDYIDHLGLIDEEIPFLSTHIVNNVIGSEIAVSGTSYAENCASVLADTVSNYAPIPLLEVKTYTGTLDIEKIDGYLQSIVIMTEQEFEPLSFIMSFTLLNEEDITLLPLVRYSDASGGVINSTPFEADKGDFAVGVICGDFGSVADGMQLLLKPTTDNLSDGSVLSNDMGQYFINSQAAENGRGIGWCYNDSTVNFVEIVFSAATLFQQNQIKSIMFGI